MKKILMVGAGIGQTFLSKKIQERGDYLITVTLPGDQPVIKIADKVCYNNVLDKEGVLRIAKEEGVDAIISDQNDTMMPTVAYVAENMNLPGLNTSQINAYCNKNVFRENCDHLGIPVPKHTPIYDSKVPEEFLNVPFPWIVKPADAQSSVGVEKVNTLQEFSSAASAAIGFSKSGSAILEEFFDGREVVAEGFIYKGKYFNLGFADRKYFELEKLFIPSQTIFPSTLDKEVLDTITTYEERMADFIKPDFAIVHSEYLYNSEKKEIRIVESALRGGGVYISSHLVPLYCGIDINETLLDCIDGKDIDMNSVMATRDNKASAYVCFYLPKGVITDIRGFEEAKNLPFVKMMFLDDVRIGEKTHALTNKGQRLGPIIISGDNREDIEENIKMLQNIIQIDVRNDDGIIEHINW